jgi:hypothetical protein
VVEDGQGVVLLDRLGEGAADAFALAFGGDEYVGNVDGEGLVADRPRESDDELVLDCDDRVRGVQDGRVKAFGIVGVAPFVGPVEPDDGGEIAVELDLADGD